MVFRRQLALQGFDPEVQTFQQKLPPQMAAGLMNARIFSATGLTQASHRPFRSMRV
jgi:hypothetical protein